MGKNKIKQFAELDTFKNVIQKDCSLKGNWSNTFFNNNNPLVLELACGKGEYTVNLGQKITDKNFIGVDIKGNRLWTGAKMALENNISNVGFLRTQIEHLQDYFEKGEIDEIWITFPDPQPQISRIKKRLTSPRFIELYRHILKPGGFIHLKTDSNLLYDYTLEVVNELNLNLIEHSNDIYNSPLLNDVLQIKTYYERKYLSKGENINYVKFTL